MMARFVSELWATPSSSRPPLTTHWIKYPWPVPEGMVNEAVAPDGEPAGVMTGLTSDPSLLPTIDQTIVRTPLVLVSARVTSELAATATSGGVAAAFTRNSAVAIRRL